MISHSNYMITEYI